MFWGTWKEEETLLSLFLLYEILKTDGKARKGRRRRIEPKNGKVVVVKMENAKIVLAFDILKDESYLKRFSTSLLACSIVHNHKIKNNEVFL